MELKKKFEIYNIQIRKQNFKEKIKKKRKKIIKEKKLFEKTGKTSITWKTTFTEREKNLVKIYNHLNELKIYKKNQNLNINNNFSQNIIDENLIHNLDKNIDEELEHLYFILKELRIDISENNNIEINPIYLVFEQKVINNILFEILQNKEINEVDIITEIFFIFSNLTSCDKKFTKILLDKGLMNFYLEFLNNSNDVVFRHILWGITNIIADFENNIFEFEEEGFWNLIFTNIRRFNFEISVIEIYSWFLNVVFDEKIVLKEYIYDQLVVTFIFIMKFLIDEIIILDFSSVLESYLLNPKFRVGRILKLYENKLIPYFSDILRTHLDNNLITSKILTIIGLISYQNEKIISEIKTEDLPNIFHNLFKINNKNLKISLITYYNLLSTNSKMFQSIFSDQILDQITLILITNNSDKITSECANILITIIIFYKNEKENLDFIINKKNLLETIFRRKETGQLTVLSLIKLLDQILHLNSKFGGTILENLCSFNFEDLFDSWAEIKNDEISEYVNRVREKYVFN